jgi:3',5'-cyclic AMP phosphodiesterase CpdA
VRTLVHLSDLHTGRIDPAVLDPLIAAVREVRADLVVLSGDLTQRATAPQFRAARAFLDALDARVLAIPGNHDVPLWNSAARFFAPLSRDKRFISQDLDPVYEDPEIIVAGVNTARSFTIGEGRISRTQVERIVRRLAAAPRGAARIIVTHHPFDLPPGVRDKRLLGRARMAMARFAEAGADLFLSGHLHISHISHSAERYRIAGHSAVIVQAGTVSTRSRGEQPSFNVLRLGGGELAVNRLVWNPERGFAKAAAGRYRRGNDGWRLVEESAPAC